MKIVSCAILIFLACGFATKTASAENSQSPGTEWGVIEMGWKGKPSRVSSGNLRIRFVGDSKMEKLSDRGEYTFAQQAVLARKPKLVLVTACSIVENLDTNGSDAGILHLQDTIKVSLYIRASETFLITPRVCVEIQY